MPHRHPWLRSQIAKLVDAARLFHLLGSRRWQQLAEVVPPHSAGAVKRKFYKLRTQGAFDHLDQSDLRLRASHKVKPLPVYPPPHTPAVAMTAAQALSVAAAEGLELLLTDKPHASTPYKFVRAQRSYGADGSAPWKFRAKVRVQNSFLHVLYQTPEEAALNVARFLRAAEKLGVYTPAEDDAPLAALSDSDGEGEAPPRSGGGCEW